MDIKLMSINGYEIEVLDVGNKFNETIVFAHGLGSNIRQFEPQISFFKENYRVISYSLQGHGESEHPDDENSYTIQSYHNTISSLLKQLNVKCCIWVGNSMGGVLGYEMLKQQPDMIKLLITNGTTPELIYSKIILKIIYIMDKLLIKIMKFDSYVRFAAKNSSKKKELVEDIYNYMKKSCPQAVIYSHQILGNYSYIQQFKNPSCPIIIIRSPYDKDINASLNKVMEYIDNNKMIEIIELPEAGHLSNIEKPKAYSNIIAKAIKNI